MIFRSGLRTILKTLAADLRNYVNAFKSHTNVNYNFSSVHTLFVIQTDQLILYREFLKMSNWRTVLFLYVYFTSLHVSSNLVLIIRRNDFINTTSGMCHSDRLVCRSVRNLTLPTCILDGHLHRLTHATCCIDTIDSPDDEHEVARNM
jgi:hypothetical protein